MRATWKRIIAVILCAVIAIASTGTNTAYAVKKTPLKVTFNGKSILVCIGYMPFGLEIKNGKVSSISFWMS